MYFSYVNKAQLLTVQSWQGSSVINKNRPRSISLLCHLHTRLLKGPRDWLSSTITSPFHLEEKKLEECHVFLFFLCKSMEFFSPISYLFIINVTKQTAAPCRLKVCIDLLPNPVSLEIKKKNVEWHHFNLNFFFFLSFI